MSKEVFLFAGDLHKRPADISTIRGYVKCVEKTQKDLIKTIIDHKVTNFVSLGDWYDRGYTSDVNCGIAHYDLDIEMHKLLNGNFYGVIGNHLWLSMESSPELMLIQPHDRIRPRNKIARDYQIIKTPDYIMVGDKVQISLVDNTFDDNALDYVVKRRPGVATHIAVFHTSVLLPSRKIEGYTARHSAPDTVISKVLEDVDIAIFGDMHKPLGVFNINSTTCIVPGSLTNTSVTASILHDKISIPKITIDKETGSCELELIPFNLNLNLVKFEDKSAKIDNSKIKTLRGKMSEEFNLCKNASSEFSITNTGISGLTLGNFLRENSYSSKDKELLLAVINAPTDLENLRKIYIKEEVKEL